MATWFSGPQSVWGDTTTDRFVPVSDAIDTTFVKDARFAIWLGAIVGAASPIKVAPGVQFSNDGVNWSDTPKRIDLSAGTPYATTDGWAMGDGSYKDLFALAGVTPRLFLRWGLMGLNGTSGADTTTQSALANLRADLKPIEAATVEAAWTKLHCAADTSVVVHALTEPIPTRDVAEYRLTLEWMEATTANLRLQGGYQLSDTPDTPSSWGAVTNIGSLLSSPAITWGTTFAALAATTKRHIRFVLQCSKITGTTVEATFARMRVDTRR